MVSGRNKHVDGIDIINVGEGRLNRLNDRFVRYLLTGPQSKPILIDLINDALLFEGRNAITDLTEISGEITPDYAGGKLSRLDVSAKLADGRTVDVELQVVNHQDFRRRALFYWSMRHRNKLKRGMTYAEIKPTICICLLAFDLLDEERAYRNSYRIRNDESGNALSDDLQIVYLELPKFRSQVELPRTGLERWLLYFSNEEGERMNKIAEMDPDILYALELENAFWGDEAEREYYLVAQKQLFDEISNERTHEVLLKQKTAEAKAEGRAEVARNLLTMGLDIDAVSKATGFSKDELLRFRV